MPSRTRSTTTVLIPLLAIIAALALVWLAQNRYIAFTNRYQETFEFPWAMWYSWVALVIVAGLFVGLGGLGSFRRGYRWTVPLIVSLPPALLLAHFVVLWGYAVPNDISFPGVLGRPNLFMDSASQFVLAIMIGVGLGLGFVRPNQSPPPKGSSLNEVAAQA